jgi:DNA polymerase-3 subunit delta'
VTPQPAFIGNEAVVGQLLARLREGRLPHAMIFSGPGGVGKHTCALRIIQALNCSAGGDEACGECVPCRKVGRGSHPDVSILSVEEDASQIRIEQVRALRDSLELAPLEGRVRATIVDPAQRLSPGAANGLLKVLEEPPPGTFFFLIATNAHDLLVTIRSRCQAYHFAPLSLEAIRALGVEDDLVARWSGGSIGWAREADAAELRRMRDQMLGFLEAGLFGDRDAIRDLVGTRLGATRQEHAKMVRAAFKIIGDLVYLKLGLEERVVNIDVRDRLGRLGAGLGIGRLIHAAGELRFVDAHLERYVNPQLMTDALLVSLGPRDAETARPNSE